jgi:fatty-acyl-CoA synthase
LVKPGASDLALLIYTSGTTGSPKAVRVSHGRILEWSFWFAGMMNVQADDRLYACLPLYHSTGGIVGIGSMLVAGASAFISPKFSATRFWDDVVNAECTIFQYIGEICRYLVNSPPHQQERCHRVRLACGNGLQEWVWTAFQKRFSIPEILEFYAASEGTVSLYNCEGKPGAIGRIPPFLAGRFPVRVVRLDPETDEPLRNSAGLCMACDPGESGEAIGLVLHETTSPARRFDGYTDAAASDRKILRDVFEFGDTWYRTGDLMWADHAGYFYFVDRIGDTFRWKGENVATSEVGSAICSCPGVVDAVVYGVSIPKHEGRAGMAAIVVSSDFDIANLKTHLSAKLPQYAQPLFVRITTKLDLTGTFKLDKKRFAEQGYSASNDPVWFNDHQMGRLILADANLLRLINEGEKRL